MCWSSNRSFSVFFIHLFRSPLTSTPFHQKKVEHDGKPLKYLGDAVICKYITLYYITLYSILFYSIILYYILLYCIILVLYMFINIYTIYIHYILYLIFYILYFIYQLYFTFYIFYKIYTPPNFQGVFLKHQPPIQQQATLGSFFIAPMFIDQHTFQRGLRFGYFGRKRFT